MNNMKIAIYRARRKKQGVADRFPSTPEDLLNLDTKFQNVQSGEKFLVRTAGFWIQCFFL